MMGRIRPEAGARPWLPARDVEEVELLDFYDIPLAGIIRQNGVMYLYTCILGQDADENLWAYAPLTKDEVVDLLVASGEQVDVAIERALWNKPVVIAAAGNYRLAVWHAIDAGVEGPIVLARRFVDRWGRELGEDVRPITRRRELVDVCA